jgi:hypothetical protein
VQGLSKFQAIAGIINLLISNKYLIILLVLALLAEHSFWFSGHDMEAQILHAIKSFKSHKHINITTVEVGVETAFNSDNNKQHPTWLIQWIIDNKLVSNTILNSLLQTLTC